MGVKLARRDFPRLADGVRDGVKGDHRGPCLRVEILKVLNSPGYSILINIITTEITERDD
jgi:hypothetical protein